MYSQGCGGSSPFDGTKLKQIVDFVIADLLIETPCATGFQSTIKNQQSTIALRT
jgi:hypothetical protein